MLALAALAWVTPCLAVLANNTIDDVFGDSITGVPPTYFPATGWRQGDACAQCPLTSQIQAQARGGSPHAGTWQVATTDTIRTWNMTVSFTGNAVYVYNIIPNSADTFIDTYLALDFHLDGDLVSTFTRFADSSSVIEFNALVYSNTSLEEGEHTLVMAAEDIQTLILFDYIEYTYTVPDNSVLPSPVSLTESRIPSSISTIQSSLMSSLSHTPKLSSPVTLTSIMSSSLIPPSSTIPQTATFSGQATTTFTSSGIPVPSQSEPSPSVITKAHNFSTRQFISIIVVAVSLFLTTVFICFFGYRRYRRSRMLSLLKPPIIVAAPTSITSTADVRTTLSSGTCAPAYAGEHGNSKTPPCIGDSDATHPHSHISQSMWSIYAQVSYTTATRGSEVMAAGTLATRGSTAKDCAYLAVHEWRLWQQLARMYGKAKTQTDYETGTLDGNTLRPEADASEPVKHSH